MLNESYTGNGDDYSRSSGFLLDQGSLDSTLQGIYDNTSYFPVTSLAKAMLEINGAV